MADNVNWDICFLCQNSVSLFTLVHQNVFLLFLIYVRTGEHFDSFPTALTNKYYYFTWFVKIQFIRLKFSVIIALMKHLEKQSPCPFFGDSKFRGKQAHFILKSGRNIFHLKLLLNIFPDEYIIISVNMTSFCCYKLFKFPTQI